MIYECIIYSKYTIKGGNKKRSQIYSDDYSDDDDNDSDVDNNNNTQS